MGKPKLMVEVSLTPRQVAEAFCDLDDEQQAQVFIEVALLASRWEASAFVGSQWFAVGRHLRDCSCSSDAARNVVSEMAAGLKHDWELRAASLPSQQGGGVNG